MKRTSWLVLGLALLAAAARAKTPPPPPCPGVRFLADKALLPGAQPFDAIVVDAQGLVAVSSDCAPIAAIRTRVRGGVRVRARWATCGTLAKVRLNVKLDTPTCSTAGGTLKAKRTKPKRFTATPSTCGDGRVDAGAGEECDTGHACPSSAPCTACTCGGSGATTTTVPGGGTTTTLPGLFEQANPWNVDVSTHPKSAQSDGIIQTLDAAGGWGGSLAKMQIDFSIHLLHATPAAPIVTFLESPSYTPGCDAPFAFPLPAGGAIEGETNYVCDRSMNDCHFLIVDPATKRLIELYNTTKSGSTLVTLCGVAWDLTKAYPPNLLGEQCTSADAGGFPIGAMLFTADEVAAGEIPHAIRFILPNARIKAGVYVHPASHAGSPNGVGNYPPYGVRFRLRADYPLATLPSDGARVVARAMQKYGMLLADGGNVALTAASDTFTTAKWSDANVSMDSHSLFNLAVTDFEVVDLGPEVALTYDCVRNP